MPWVLLCQALWAGVAFALQVAEGKNTCGDLIKSITFDGCGSEGDITNYQWTIIEAPDAQSDAVGKPLRTEMDDCSFELESAMIIDDVGEWTIELVVTDGDTEASDQVVVTVAG